MTNNKNDEREKNQGEQDADAAHPFDQTNGIVDGLDGDADSPEQADKKTGEGNNAGFLAVPAPGAQMPAGVVPVVREQESDTGADDLD